MKHPHLLVLLCLLLSVCNVSTAQYPGWQHSGSLFILTTPAGAPLPPAASEEGFPLLVRLHKDFFNFAQARASGEDIRFASGTGQPLAYQVEEWDAAQGVASVWVRIPAIRGNQRQEIKLYWGNPDAPSESSGNAVFNTSNGFLSVWHMNPPVKDEVGTLPSKDVGTASSTGMIGPARHFAGKQGIFCGDKIPDYPSADAPHTTQAWFRIDKPNATLIGWGNEGGGRGSKVRMQFRSPPHIRIDSDFADVKSESRLPMAQWIHVTHTYSRNDGRIYINGQLDGSARPLLQIKSPARLWIGGWYNNFDFVGDIDEVRISRVARSADWVKLEYENQKIHQTLVGPLVQPGNAFSVSPGQLVVNEGRSATVTAQAGGAQKIYWILKRGGQETTVASDRLHYRFEAGRITGDQSATLVFKAIYPDQIKTREIPITIKESVPDPLFTLRAPDAWDGRSTIEVVAELANQSALHAAGADDVRYEWSVSPIAVIKEAGPAKLILTRAQNSGPMRVQACARNGGTKVHQQIEIRVTEPARDAWIAPAPAGPEMPQDNQFYARDDQNTGTLSCNGTLDTPAEWVFLKLYADGRLIDTQAARPGADRSYALSARLKPGLIQYNLEFGTRANDGGEKILHTARSLVCGDVYLINGQSNAEATAWGKEEYTFTSPWIRSFGSTHSDPQNARLKLWHNAAARSSGGKAQIGCWGMELARQLVENHKIPICILNGAVGGTRIDQHQRNPADPQDVNTIYGRLLWRTRQAKLTHGVRAVFWHQGENDQGADGPTGGFGYETYHHYFNELAAAWKQDFPNLQHYYLFQIWPKACSMGVNGSDNRLREVQRTLPRAFSRMSIMSTLGINPPGTCHYPPAGYAAMARLICPLVERDHYGKTFTTAITPPNLLRSRYTDAQNQQIILEFDQPVKWNDALASQFYLDGEKGKVVSGSAAGNTVTLKLAAPSSARTITYLDSASWKPEILLRGENGIAALTFCEVPLQAAPVQTPRDQR